MKKKQALLYLILFIPLFSFSQEHPEKLFDTKVYNYNGWKIKKGEMLTLQNQTKFSIKKMQWTRYRGMDFVLAFGKINGIDTLIDLRQAIWEDKIILPNGIKKLEPLQPVYSDEVKPTEDTITLSTGVKLYVGAPVLTGTGVQTNGNFKYIYQKRVDFISGGFPKFYMPSSFGNQRMFVREMFLVGCTERGYHYQIILGGPDFINEYECEADRASASGELLTN